MFHPALALATICFLAAPSSSGVKTEEDDLRPYLTAMDAAGTRFRFCIPEVLLPDRVYRTADGDALWGWASHPTWGWPHLWLDVSRPRAVLLSAELGVPLIKRDKPLIEVSANWRLANATFEVGEPILVELELTNVGQGTVKTAVVGENCNRDSQYAPNFRCELRHRGSYLRPTVLSPRGGSVLIVPLEPGDSVEGEFCVSRRYSPEIPGEYALDVSYDFRVSPTRRTTRAPSDAREHAWFEHRETFRCTLFLRLNAKD